MSMGVLACRVLEAERCGEPGTHGGTGAQPHERRCCVLSVWPPQEAFLGGTPTVVSIVSLLEECPRMDAAPVLLCAGR